MPKTFFVLFFQANFGELPSGEEKVCLDPLSVIFGDSVHSRTCRILMMLVVPGHLLFALTISFFNLGHTTVTPIFVLFYICAAFLQIWILLHTAHWMIHCVSNDFTSFFTHSSFFQKFIFF